MIEISNLSFGYKSKKEVLKNINLKIEDNEMIAVIGKNGSRKVYTCRQNYREDRYPHRTWDAGAGTR